MLSRAVRPSAGVITTRQFSQLAPRFSEGKPSGMGSTSFQKKEHAEEDQYLRIRDREKLQALRKKMESDLKKQQEKLDGLKEHEKKVAQESQEKK